MIPPSPSLLYGVLNSANAHERAVAFKGGGRGGVSLTWSLGSTGLEGRGLPSLLKGRQGPAARGGCVCMRACVQTENV